MGWVGVWAGKGACQIAEWNATAGLSLARSLSLCHCSVYLLIHYSITFTVFALIKIVPYISTFFYLFTSRYIGLHWSVCIQRNTLILCSPAAYRTFKNKEIETTWIGSSFLYYTSAHFLPSQNICKWNEFKMLTFLRVMKIKGDCIKYVAKLL